MLSPVCNSLVLKVASRCNLNCTYCYMYNAGDTTYKSQPKVMHSDTVQAVCRAVNIHCNNHQLKGFEFVFHGGEPLLAGKLFFKEFIRLAEKIISKDIRVSYSMQTNGLLIDDEWCLLLSSLQISIGISLDGVKETNDEFRKDHKGRGSYDNIIKAIEKAEKYNFLRDNLGILTVINVSSDATALYKKFKSLGIRNFNLLLPYVTHHLLPLSMITAMRSNTSSYANWLVQIFNVWFEDEHRPQIRLFTSIMELFVGIENAFDYFGKAKIEYLVIETDGSIEPAGALKLCGNGFTKIGMNIRCNSLDEALENPLIKLYHFSHLVVPSKCKTCPLIHICGGGHMPTRFSTKNAFNNPSVYCLDYMKLITHIQERLWQVLPVSVTGKLNKVTFAEMKSYHLAYQKLNQAYGT